jgi:hypothetical protein
MEPDLDWIAQWAEWLAQEHAVPWLAEDLRDRWSENMPDYSPRGLAADSVTHLTGRWWDALELFLLDDRCSQAAAVTVLHAISTAFEELKPDLLMGEVWLNDVLALRRARAFGVGGAEADRRAACKLMITALGTLHDKYPNPTADAYKYFARLYAAVTNAMVVEIYEPVLMENQRRDGRRVTSPCDFTLFTELDEDRRESSEASETELKSDYKRLVRGLFRTLSALSAAAMSTGTSDMDGRYFYEKLQDFGKKNKKRNKDDEFSNIFGASEERVKYGLQRTLDVYFRRISYISSKEDLKNSKIIFDFITYIAGVLGNKEIQSSEIDWFFSLPCGDGLIRSPISQAQGAILTLSKGFSGADRSEDNCFVAASRDQL